VHTATIHLCASLRANGTLRSRQSAPRDRGAPRRSRSRSKALTDGSVASAAKRLSVSSLGSTREDACLPDAANMNGIGIYVGVRYATKMPQRERTGATFLAVQLPMADARLLMVGETGRLPVPHWPDPLVGKEYVRSSGLVRYRTGGPPDGLFQEYHYCDARRLIRFPRAASQDLAERNLSVSFRRLYSSGVPFRAEVGFSVSPKLNGLSAADLARSVLGQRVSIFPNSKSIQLGDAGAAISRRLLHVTTSQYRGRGRNELPLSWLQPGMPLVVIERTVPRSIISDSNVATCSLIPFGSQVLPVWEFEYCWNSDFARMRTIRAAVWRLHSEVEGLRGILREWSREQGNYDYYKPMLDPEYLRDYLELQCRVLAKVRRRGVLQGVLVNQALDRAVLGEPEMLSSLRKELGRQSKGVLRRLDTIIERSLATTLAGQLKLTMVGGHMTVEGDHYEFNAAASGVFGRQGMVASNTFKQVTEGGELAIDQLVSAIDELIPKLSPEDAKELRDIRFQIRFLRIDLPRRRVRMRLVLKQAAGVAVFAGEPGMLVLEMIRKVGAELAGEN